MKKILTLFITLGLIFGAVKSAAAGNTANQTVTFEVSKIYEIGVSGDPGAFTLSSLSEDPEVLVPASDSSTTYNISFNAPALIFAELLSEMPSWTSFYVRLDPPSGGISEGEKVLNDFAQGFPLSPQRLVYINEYAVDINKTIHYRLEATIWADVGSGTNTVRFTIGGL